MIEKLQFLYAKEVHELNRKRQVDCYRDMKRQMS